MPTPHSPSFRLAALGALVLTLAACGGDPLKTVLAVDPQLQPDYTLVESKRQDLAGKPRVSATITLPAGLDKARLEGNMRHAILVAHEGSAITPGAIRVRAFQGKVEDRPYTAALAIFSPDGSWTNADPTQPPATWKISLTVRDWYLRGQAPPPLPGATSPVDGLPPPSPAIAGLQPGAPSGAAPLAPGAPGAPGPGDRATPTEAKAPGGAVQASAATASPGPQAALKVFAIDHTGKPAAGTLRIDDQIVGKTPWTGQVSTGTHKVSVNWRFTMATVKAQGPNTVTIRLPPPKAAAPPPKAVEPVGGQLAKSKIIAGIQKDLGGLRSCYEQELKKDQMLRGKIVLGFVIDQDGHVARAAITTSEIDNVKVQRCIVARVKRLRFEKPEGGSVEVAYPLNFKPKG